MAIAVRIFSTETKKSFSLTWKKWNALYQKKYRKAANKVDSLPRSLFNNGRTAKGAIAHRWFFLPRVCARLRVVKFLKRKGFWKKYLSIVAKWDWGIFHAFRETRAAALAFAPGKLILLFPPWCGFVINVFQQIVFLVGENSLSAHKAKDNGKPKELHFRLRWFVLTTGCFLYHLLPYYSYDTT